MNKTVKNERIVFRLFNLSCCGHFLCWVNPRFPSFCPNCGKHIYPDVKGDVVITDENAHIKFHASAPIYFTTPEVENND